MTCGNNNDTKIPHAMFPNPTTSIAKPSDKLSYAN